MTSDVSIKKPPQLKGNPELAAKLGAMNKGKPHKITIAKEQLVKYKAAKKLSPREEARLIKEGKDLFLQIVIDAFRSPNPDVRRDAAKNFGKYFISEAPKELLANVNEAITVNILYNNELAKKEIKEAEFREIGSALPEKKRPGRPKKLRQGDQGENSGES